MDSLERNKQRYGDLAIAGFIAALNEKLPPNDKGFVWLLEDYCYCTTIELCVEYDLGWLRFEWDESGEALEEALSNYIQVRGLYVNEVEGMIRRALCRQRKCRELWGMHLPNRFKNLIKCDIASEGILEEYAFSMYALGFRNQQTCDLVAILSTLDTPAQKQMVILGNHHVNLFCERLRGFTEEFSGQPSGAFVEKHGSGAIPYFDEFTY